MDAEADPRPVGGARQQPGRYPVPSSSSSASDASQIEAVAMDVNTAFDLEVKQHCLQAEVVYDLFHVVARYGREVVDRVRKWSRRMH